MTSVPNLKYKTTLCNNWSQDKQCAKGDSCFFAHGYDQLRSMEQNQALLMKRQQRYKTQKVDTNHSTNFKTVFCKFFKKGQCMLGQKCTFIHNQNQRRNPPIAKIQQNKQDMSWHQYSQMCWMMANSSNIFRTQNNLQNYYYFNPLNFTQRGQNLLGQTKYNSSFSQVSQYQKTQKNPKE